MCMVSVTMNCSFKGIIYVQHRYQFSNAQFIIQSIINAINASKLLHPSMASFTSAVPPVGMKMDSAAGPASAGSVLLRIVPRPSRRSLCAPSLPSRRIPCGVRHSAVPVLIPAGSAPPFVGPLALRAQDCGSVDVCCERS